MSEPDSTQVLVGPALLYVAPLGTEIPTINMHGEIPIVWPDGWEALGFTDAGVDETYTPTLVEINVDEVAAPIADILSKEAYAITAALAEATMANLNRAMSASVFTDDTVNGVRKIAVGSKALNYMMVGLQGPAPGTNLGRIVIVQKAIASAAVAQKHTRTKNTTIPITFTARQISGQDLVDIYEFESIAS